MVDPGMSKEEWIRRQMASRDDRLRKILVDDAVKAGMEYPGNIIFKGAVVPIEIVCAALTRVAEESCNQGFELGQFMAEVEAETPKP